MPHHGGQAFQQKTGLLRLVNSQQHQHLAQSQILVCGDCVVLAFLEDGRQLLEGVRAKELAAQQGGVSTWGNGDGPLAHRPAGQCLQLQLPLLQHPLHGGPLQTAQQRRSPKYKDGQHQAEGKEQLLHILNPF